MQASDIPATGSWSNVTKRRTRRNPKSNLRVRNDSGGPTVNINPPVAHEPASVSNREPQGTKVLVEGKRKGLTVKRKFKTQPYSANSPGAAGHRGTSKWWFIVTGEESLLKQLQQEWSALSLQTNWSLEPVYTWSDAQLPSAPVTTHQATEQLESPHSEHPGTPSNAVSPSTIPPSLPPQD